MAKRKSGKKKATRRRRSVGAMSLSASNPLVKYGSILGGFFLGDKINAGIDKFTGTVDAKLVGGATAGVGAALVFMKLGKKKTVLQVAGGGVLLGAGAKRLAKSLGIINGIGGYGSVPVIGRRGVNGYGSVPVIGGAFNGYTVPQSMNGAFNGYTVPRSMNSVMGNASGSGLLSSDMD